MAGVHFDTITSHDMASLGSYSYKNPDAAKSKTYTYTNGTQTFYFKIVYVNSNVAAVQFFNDQTYTSSMPIPAGFTMSDSTGQLKPYQDAFFISWVENYTLWYNNGTLNAPIWLLANQKQQSVHSTGGADVKRVQV